MPAKEACEETVSPACPESTTDIHQANPVTMSNYKQRRHSERGIHPKPPVLNGLEVVILDVASG